MCGVDGLGEAVLFVHNGEPLSTGYKNTDKGVVRRKGQKFVRKKRNGKILNISRLDCLVLVSFPIISYTCTCSLCSDCRTSECQRMQ